MLGYHVIVVDARGHLATPERFPAADQVLVEWPDDALAQIGLDSACAVVVLTHDPKFDQPALQAALASPARYVGAIGSRSTNEQRMADLRALGLPDEQLARIHAPSGLYIGAQTPAEIALAIMAEIVAAGRQRGGGSLRGASQQPALVQDAADAAGLSASGGVTGT
jgi:xanthine dehydrogenase accessory factor